MGNQVSNTDKHVKLYITYLNHYGFIKETKKVKINYTIAEAQTISPK